MKTISELTTERDTVLDRLTTRWRWLDEHKDHPQFTEREDAVLEDLKMFESLENAIKELAA